MQESASVAVIGVTGFIGRELARRLGARGVPVTGVSRSAGAEQEGVSRWQTTRGLDLSGHRAVVNLAGRPVDCRWTEANRREIRDSREGMTRRLVEHLASLPESQRPPVLVNGSAIGVYGDCGDGMVDESSPPGEGFLAEVCVAWEAAAREAEALGVRVACLRTGIVLGRGGMAFDKLRRVFGLGLGGRLGNGRQWMPWIHLDDLVGAIVHLLEIPDVTGPVNGVAPHPERNAVFTRKLAETLHRPAWFTVPGPVLKLTLGGFGAAMLEGQRAVPLALLESGYEFRFPELEGALEDLCGPVGNVPESGQ